MSQIAIFASQNKLNARITDNMREQIKALKKIKELPKKEMDKVKEDLADVEYDMAVYMDRSFNLKNKIDNILLKVI